MSLPSATTADLLALIRNLRPPGQGSTSGAIAPIQFTPVQMQLIQSLLHGSHTPTAPTQNTMAKPPATPNVANMPAQHKPKPASKPAPKKTKNKRPPKVKEILGMDKNEKGELMYCVIYNNTKVPVMVSSIDMKRYYLQDLITFLESHIELSANPMET